MLQARTKTPSFSVPWLAYLTAIALMSLTGCWAPLRYDGIPASSLPAEFRVPRRTALEPLNLAHLTLPATSEYLLGPDDVLEIAVPGVLESDPSRPIRATVMPDGKLSLPLIGPLGVNNLTVPQAQQAITRAYAPSVKNPIVHLSLAEKSTIRVLVLGQVNKQGVHALPKYENDVGHAIAAAEGLSEEAADVIEIHKRGALGDDQIKTYEELVPPSPRAFGNYLDAAAACELAPGVIRIPLRGFAADAIDRELITLAAGDVVVVPTRRSEVFYVVGKLIETNLLRFSLDESQRELGVGFLLPRNREIDVVTAVAMAGYIDPIDSPTTVLVHRVLPDGRPMLIHVDLIAARSNPLETILVEPDDIIYLNPDFPWWFRRTFDRVVPDLITIPYARAFRINVR
jgi:protein involved in polysaccharide export with SLBB domain